ncbi:MAG: extracellular solute-binding protein [Lachnospiraceae bacterium]|nr:extracellular solute-binding protein [Lachnospiraceae bacterium]
MPGEETICKGKKKEKRSSKKSEERSGKKSEKRSRRGWTLRLNCIVVSVCLLFLSGCDVVREETAVEGPVTITIWTKDRHDLDFQQKKIKEFNQAHEGEINVKYKVYSGNYTQAVSSAIGNGTAPDIFSYNGEIYDRFVAQKEFVNLLPYMDDSKMEAFSEAMVEGINVSQGKCYYLPTGISAVRLIYNKDLLKKAGIDAPPQTLEELIEDARTVAAQFGDQGVYGFALNLKEAQSALNRSFMKEAMIETGLKSGYDFSRGVYDFAAYADLVEKWRVLLSAECSYPYCEDLGIDPLREMFSEGRIAMYFTYGYSETGIYQSQFPMEQEWGAAPVPICRDTEAVGSASYTLNGGFLISSQSLHVEEAMTVYWELLANKKNLAEHYERGLSVSIFSDIVENAKKNGCCISEISERNQREHLWPDTPKERFPENMNVVGSSWADTLKSLLLSDVDAEPVLEELSSRYNRAYQEMIKNGLCSEIKIAGFDPASPELILDYTKK